MGGSSRHTAALLLKNMKVISAYMLAVVGGNDKPSVSDVKQILSSVGIDLDGDASTRLEELVEEMSGKDLAEVLAAGQEKLKTVPGGSGGGAPAAGGAVGTTGGGDAPAAAPKEESEEEEEDIPAAGGLFDDGDDY